jgi:hypothetical protein
MKLLYIEHTCDEGRKTKDETTEHSLFIVRLRFEARFVESGPGKIRQLLV